MEVAGGRCTRLLVNMPPRHGKCIAIGTPILLSNGLHKPVEELLPTDEIVCVNDLCNYETDKVISKVLTGNKTVYTITLSNTCYIQCTEDHRILTDKGWKTLKQINLSDLVASILPGPTAKFRDIYWVDIVSIIKYGDYPTIDIETYKYHNFFANGIVTHNSELISKYFPAWYLGNFPDNKIIFSTYSSSFAEEWGEAARDLIDEYGSEVFNVHISKKSRSSAKWSIEESKSGVMYSVGAGSALTGRGANVLIIDDPIKNPLFVETEIPTPEGWKILKNIQVGDFVFDHTGTPTKVIAVSDVIKSKKCKITFCDGSEVICDKNHSWTLFTRNEHSCYTNKNKKYGENWWKWCNRGNSKARTFTIEEMFEIGLRNHKNQTNYTIPTTLPLNLPHKEYDIDPYLFGLWLGDGTSGDVALTAHKDDAVFYTNYIEGLGIFCRDRLPSPKAREKSPNTIILKMSLHEGNDRGWKDSLISKFKLTKTDDKKDVPIEYLRGSIFQRLELLQGLMDTDGIVAHGQVVFCNKNRKIIDAAYDLFVSLGSNATIHDKENEYGIYWTVSACPIMCPFKLPRKVKKWEEDTGKPSIRRLNRTVYNIEFFDEEIECKCINVEADSHLFLCGKGMIPTHNSEQASSITEKEKIWSWFGCFHPDHDLLTSDGWVNITDITKDMELASPNPQTLEIEYIKPSEIHKYDYNGFLYEYFNMRSTSFCVTPNHNMWIRLHNSNRLLNFPCEDLPDKCYIPQRFDWKGINHDYPKNYETLFPLFSFILCSKHKIVSKDRVEVRINGPDSQLRKLMENAGFGNYTYKSKLIVILPEKLSEYIAFFNKRLPKKYKTYPPHVLRKFLEPFYTSEQGVINHLSTKMLSDMGEIALKCGFRVSYKKDRLIFSNTDEILLLPWSCGAYRHQSHRLNGLKRVQYKGFVYCVTVPKNHSVITRYKGKVSISGQSTSYTRLQPGNSAIIVIQCVEENQRVLVKYKGLVPIKKVQIDDIVYSLSKVDSKVTERKVLNIKNSGEDYIYEVKTDRNTVKVNKDHPFLYYSLVEGFVWTKCEDLKEGHLVCTLKSLKKDKGGFYNISIDQVRSITKLTNKAPVWDLTIEEDENFICEGFILHNTRWCEDDLAGRLIANMDKGSGEKWDVLNFPAIAEEDEPEGLMRKKGEALWPEMWPLETLLKIKNSGAISSYAWSSLYQQRPTPEGGGMFKSDWFRYFSEQPLYYVCEGKNGEATKFIQIDSCWLFATIDMANKVKATSDYTVVAVWAVSPQNDLLLLKMYRDRYPYEEVLRKVEQVCKEYKVKYVGIENVGVGIQLINECINKGYPIRALEPQGRGKENRANAPLGAVVRMESGKIYFKRGESVDLETELLHFPKGKNDDAVDALSYACNELTKLDTYEDNDFAPYSIDDIINLQTPGAQNSYRRSR